MPVPSPQIVARTNTKVDPPHTPNFFSHPQQDTPTHPSSQAFRNRGLSFPPGTASEPIHPSYQPPPRPAPTAPGDPVHPSSTGQRRVSGRGPRPPPRSRGRFGRGPTSPLPGPHRGASHSAPQLAPTQLVPTPRAGSGPPGAGLGGHVGGPGTPRRPRSSSARGPPSGAARPHAEAAPPTGPAAPTTGAALTAMPGSGPCGLGPAQAWLRPRAVTSRAASWRPRRSRRGRTARGRPSAAPSAVAASSRPGRGDHCSAAPGAGTPASVEPNRPGRAPRPALVAYAERPPPIGPRAVARAGLSLSNSGGEREAGGPGGAGLLRVSRRSRGGRDPAAAAAAAGRERGRPRRKGRWRRKEGRQVLRPRLEPRGAGSLLGGKGHPRKRTENAVSYCCKVCI